ncbi:hypothetical protein TWF694_007190 [Orbilia ellipsospora]|uniref:Uncharacterized protein n=1 Tax=Orbilia ellipsospora TaxID=2528407 RepID=A0AAV9XIG2_9PEZI
MPAASTLEIALRQLLLKLFALEFALKVVLRLRTCHRAISLGILRFWGPPVDRKTWYFSPPKSYTQPAVMSKPTELQDGYFDHVVAIFQKHNVPMVIVKEYGYNWLGSGSGPNRNVDFLIRDSGLDAISSALLDSGCFKKVDQDLNYRLSDEYCFQVPRYVDIIYRPNMWPKWVNIWTQSVYMLRIDDMQSLYRSQIFSPRPANRSLYLRRTAS